MTWASSLALDRRYPVVDVPPAPRPGLSADRLEPVAPRGDVRGDVAFEWRWSGARQRWRVTVLDADLQPVLCSDVVDESRLAAPIDLLPALAATAGHFWQVQAVDDPSLRTSPVWFRVTDRDDAAAEPATEPPR